MHCKWPLINNAQVLSNLQKLSLALGNNHSHIVLYHEFDISSKNGPHFHVEFGVHGKSYLSGHLGCIESVTQSLMLLDTMLQNYFYIVT
jgi:hypothetical protein